MQKGDPGMIMILMSGVMLRFCFRRWCEFLVPVEGCVVSSSPSVGFILLSTLPYLCILLFKRRGLLSLHIASVCAAF